MAKTFNKIAAQGDFMIIMVNMIPEDAIKIDQTGGYHVVAHSETGHNHVMDATHVKAFELKKPDIYTMFLQVDEPTEIIHQRSFDTHEPILVNPGSYMIKRQREYVPEGFRKAQD